MKGIGKIFGVVLLGGVIILFFKAFGFYNNNFKNNINVSGDAKVSLYVYDYMDFADVMDTLSQKGYLLNSQQFKKYAVRKNIEGNIKPGHYLLKKGMTNNNLVNMLRGGLQTPVKVVFHNIRFKEELAERLAEQLMPDSAAFASAFNHDSLLAGYGFTPTTIPAMFLPNTYEFYWTTTPVDYLSRMHTEYEKFWNEDRMEKLNRLGLEKVEVSTLASIVDEETSYNPEKSTIAGVYINRLEKGMRLQADPTVKFALGSFHIKRILKRHLDIDSPYNTYKYAGLPPGPIRIPGLNTIDAVLNYKEHDYIFFCAKADFSGQHAFAKTLAEHNRNARLYQRALNSNRIYR